MKNFELENVELKSLSNDEMRQIEGGDILDWLDKHWTAIKAEFKATYNEAMSHCNCH